MWPVSRQVPLDTTMCSCVVAFCDGQEVQICETEFSVAFYLVRSGRKFYFMLATNRTPNK